MTRANGHPHGSADDGSLYREAVGRVTRGLRADRGWSLRELNGRSGVSVPYLSEIERGLKDPSGAMLAQLAAAFALSLPDLLHQVAASVEERQSALPELSPDRESLLRALDDLGDAALSEVTEFLDYLRWRRERPERG